MFAQGESYEELSDSIYREVHTAFNYFQQSKYGKAIETYTSILKYAIKTEDAILEGNCYAGLANSHYFIDKEDTLSFYYLFKARDIFIREKDTFNLALVYNDIGVNYMSSDNIDASNEYFDKAIKLAKARGSLYDEIYPLVNIAFNEMDIGKIREGIAHSQEALALIDDLDEYQNLRIVANLYAQLAFGYFKIDDIENHALYFNKCVDFSKKHGYIEILASLYKDQSVLQFERKNYSKAYDLVNKTLILRDSLQKMKEYEKAKQIEADNFLSENKDKLLLVEKEKEYQDRILKKTRVYTIIVTIFVIGLLLSMYFIFKKNKQLNLAKENAEKLSKAKSDFYSEISHELRTPLYAVIELSRLLLNENVNSTHKEYLESLNFSGNHLLSLINNVLEINKVESGEMKLQMLDFKLKNLINNITESLEFALRDSHNKIHVDYDTDIPRVLVGDSLKLSQVFINLISNAIKFTRNGTIYITAKLVATSKDTVTVFFQVKDDGIGISKEKQAAIFEDFYQEHTKTKNSYKGSGLGLSIVKRILTAMDSEINIESEVDKGSAFDFELVFFKSESSVSKENEFEFLLKSLIDKRILIVDDNKINQLVTKKILDQFNIKTSVVDSGSKAIEMVKNEYFDCILMDLHMPGLDGYETTNYIRKFNKDIAIIALTAAATEEVEHKISSYEMNGHIMKPFIISDLIETIYRAVLKT